MRLFVFRLVIILSAICLVCTLLGFTYAADLSKPYTPTRQEWLEMSIFKRIKAKTDSWYQRIGFTVWIGMEENTIFITLTSANGQMELSREAQKRYVDAVQESVEALINEYEWSKSLRVYVQYM